MLLYQILAFSYTWKNEKKSYKNNKFKILAPTWYEEFKLPNGSCTPHLSYSVRMPEITDQNNSEYGQFLRSISVSDNQPYSEHIIKRHETVTNNPSEKT